MRVKKSNNKGMAMVTVLIAITFVGILAASLMYMSYMNFIAKSVRYSSTDNFYTTEYGLAELSTSLQNRAANSSTVTAAMNRFTNEEISTPLGMKKILTVNPNNTSINCYDCVALEALVQSANQEADIEILTTYDDDGDGWADTDNYILDTKSITFLGVRIRSTTADGFVTTISTDIKITFDNKPGDMSVNDFSVITDSPLEVSDKCVVMSGNIFIGSRGNADGNALTISNISVVTLLSKKGIIHGNVVVNDGCTLILTGDITVYGQITVKKGGTLICTGNLVHTKELDIKTGAILKGISKSHPHNPSLPGIGVDGDEDGTEDGYLASAILSSIYVQDKDGSGWKKCDLNSFMNATGGLPNAGYKKYQTADGSISTRVGIEHPCNGVSNSLIINDGYNLELRGWANNSTIVSTSPITFFGDHESTYMQCMNDEDYDKARNILISGEGQINGLDGHNYSFQGGDLKKTVFFPIASADSKVITTPDPINGIEGRTVYYLNQKNYVPLGYFIAENADSILSDAFSASQGDSDPKNSTVSYAHWNKE